MNLIQIAIYPLPFLKVHDKIVFVDLIKEVKFLANIKSSIKRIKITRTRTLRNKSIKSSVRTAIKKFEAAIAEGDLDKARSLLPEVTSKIDKAVAKGVFHKNAANRKKSKLALKLQAAQNQE